MCKRLVTYFSIFAFITCEPSVFLSHALAGQCQQHKQKIEQACAQNPSLRNGAVNGNIEGIGQLNDALAQKRTTESAMGNFTAASAQCGAANQQCQSDCQQEYQQAMQKKPPDMQKAQQAQKQMQECGQKSAEQQAKNSSALADLAKLLAALMSLIAALSGKDEKKEDFAEAKKEEEKDVCDTPEGAVLLKCQGESDPLKARASLNGLANVASVNGGTGQTLARPAGGGPSSEGGSSTGGGAAGAATAGGGDSGGTNGDFGVTALNAPVKDGEKGKEKDIHNGFHEGGGGGGGNAFSGDGSGTSFNALTSDDPFAKGKDDEADKLKKSKKLAAKLAAKGDRAVAGTGDLTGMGGPFQDNFLIIKKAYDQARPSLE